MARTDPQVNLRLPAELKASIDEAARNAGRSTNAEVVARLQSSFEDRSDSAATAALAAALANAKFDSARMGLALIKVLQSIRATDSARENRKKFQLWREMAEKAVQESYPAMDRMLDLLGELKDSPGAPDELIEKIKGLERPSDDR